MHDRVTPRAILLMVLPAAALAHWQSFDLLGGFAVALIGLAGAMLFAPRASRRQVAPLLVMLAAMMIASAAARPEVRQWLA